VNQAAKGVQPSWDVFTDLLECFVGRLDIFTQLSLAAAMIVKVIVELISTVVLVTEELKQRQPIESSPFLLTHYLTSTQRNAGKFLKRKIFGDKNIETILQTMDQLTQDEARTTVAQTPGVVHCLVESMKEFMDDEKTHPVCNPVSVGSISL